MGQRCCGNSGGLPKTFGMRVYQLLLKNKWLWLSFLAFVLLNYFYFSHLFAFRFVDEEDNLVLGYFVLQGEKIYSDLFSHHQPFAYLISALFQLITQPKDIYSLIFEHRLFMIFWSLIWIGGLIWRFREKVIAPLFIFEISKFFLLGNLFLSESIAVYPIVYLVLFLIEKNIRVKKYEHGFVGLCVGLVAMLLAPMWPFLFFYTAFLYWFKKLSKHDIRNFLIGFFIPIVIAIPFINLYYYFHNAFYINYKYYIPQSAEEKMPMALIKAFLSPITIYLHRFDLQSSGLILQLIGVWFVGAIVGLIIERKWKILSVIIILLTLANIRYYTPGLEYKAGFHEIIWYSLFILLSLYFGSEFIGNLLKKTNVVIIGALVITMGISIWSTQSLFSIHNRQADFNKNYEAPLVFGQAIKAMGQPSDTLFVAPDEWLLYIEGDVKNNNRMVNYYPWMSLVWEIHDYVEDNFSKNPPQFFYCDCDSQTVLSYSENYRQMIRNGALTPLWISKEKFNSLNGEQRDKLRALNFQLE